MRSLNGQTRHWFCFALPIVYVLCGCQGADPLTAQGRELDDLRYHNERKRESLIESMAETERQLQVVAAVQAEKKALSLRISGLETQLGSTGEELEMVRAKRDSLTTQLKDSRRGNERLHQSIDKVRSVAADSATELTDLRLKSRDLQARVHTLEEVESTLRVEHSDLSNELERVQGELVRTRAVARSFREGGNPDASAIDLSVREPLESQIAVLREEKRALQRRLGAVGSANAGASLPHRGPAPGEVYRDDPAGLLAEFGGLAQARYRRALQGQVAWDFFDLAIAGVVVLPLLLAIWILVRRAQWRKTIKSLRPRAAGREVQAASASSVPTSAARGRGYRPARRGGFSAVISSQAADQPAEALDAVTATTSEADPLDGVLEEDIVQPAAQRAPASAHEEPAGPEPRRVIGARVWMEDIDESVAEDEDEDIGNTQIIPKLSMEDLAAHGKTEAGGPKGASEAESLSPDDDKDLLSELKSVINKKFDELLK